MIKTEKITFRTSIELKEKLQEIANQNQVSIGQLIRSFVEFLLQYPLKQNG